MLTIVNAQSIDGELVSVTIPSIEDRVFDATGLVLMPALIDPHVHFRTPGLEHKEDWKTAARAAIRGGISTVFDMPNTVPPTTSRSRLLEKTALIDAQLEEVGIPLRYGLYLGADRDQFAEIAPASPVAVGLKIFMGSSTGGLVMEDEESLHTAFRLAAESDLLVAVHAEDEALIRERREEFGGNSPEFHSIVRNEEVAARATEKAISLARLYGTRLYILHVSTAEEVALIAKAKEEGLSVFAETTPHHLFLSTDAYAELGNKALVNPPLRAREHQEALWEGIHSGVIDTIGSDHAPHTLAEKGEPYGKAPSGLPGIETTLPLLLNAASQGKLTLKDIVRLMRTRILEIFRLPENDDWILVDLNRVREVKEAELATRCGWSPYAGWSLQGWPVQMILKGTLYPLVEERGLPAPIYDISKSYEENVICGPVSPEKVPERVFPPEKEWIDFLGYRVASAIGIPAGPLLTADWVALASRLGYDILTYKTIRSGALPSHPLPNMLYVDTGGMIDLKEPPRPMLGHLDPPREFADLAVTNSFGMPSQSPEFLMEDIPKAKRSLRAGQVLVVSVVGSVVPERSFVEDFVAAARLACEAGAPIIEANFSCPNVDKCAGALYLSAEAVFEIGSAIVRAIGPVPLIIKVGVFPSEEQMRAVMVAAARAGVRGFAGINTISRPVVDRMGNPALGEGRLTSGICGGPIRSAALDFIRSAHMINNQERLSLTLIGVGGVILPEHFDEFFEAGADVAMSATGMLWNPYLALNYRKKECLKIN